MAAVTSRNTLSRPDRSTGGPKPMVGEKAEKEKTSWVIFSRVVTFWAPAGCMRQCGMKEPGVQQAWREKVSLVFLIILVCGFVAFFTLALQGLLCNAEIRNPAEFVDFNKAGWTSIYGRSYEIRWQSEPVREAILGANGDGNDVTGEVYSQSQVNDPDSPIADLRACTNLPENYGIVEYEGACDSNNSCLDVQEDRLAPPVFTDAQTTEYKWEDIYDPELDVFALDGIAVNLKRYFEEYPEPRENDKIDAAFRLFNNRDYEQNGIPARDMTRMFLSDFELNDAIPCVKAKFGAGVVEKDPATCFLASLIYWASLIVILSIVLVRFFMALIFGWFISPRISSPPSAEKLARIKSGDEGARNAKFNDNDRLADPTQLGQVAMNEVSGSVTAQRNKGASAEDNPRELYTILLVTAYSEGEEGLRTTCDSLASTQYSDHKKLIFVVADGYVKGDGNDKTTPEVVKDIMDLDHHFGVEPDPQSYIAIASGKKQHNMVKIYVGHYNCGGHRTPMMLVAKCGTPAEKNEKKPGNRGKRDSQIILMHFFSRVMVNERMTPCDADLFRKIHYLMGVTADKFEMVLMVDADTMVYPDSLPLLINAAQNNQAIMGLCGETKIANKRTSWITWIQVFEYYISHHLGKGFESVFGGVTCLPGCFCMYRLKVRKGPNSWVPILANRDIADEYSSNVTETLHQKNLLLLGEDRFLTTLMLRLFPQRQMVFVPQAVCKTVIPDTFKVLLSQRRRWINSTVHNLMELVLVRNLCGVFCCSMQFVIVLEIFGTVSLPIAIFLTYLLIIKAPIDIANMEDPQAGDYIPIIMLVVVLFLPAVLIMLTTLKLVYIGWMFAYLILGLPIWNFVLPVYAYWHFDDFSWGETRKVEGGGSDDHGEKEGTFDVTSVPLKRWEEWEKLYRKRAARIAAGQDPDQSAWSGNQSSNQTATPPSHYPNSSGATGSGYNNTGGQSTHVQFQNASGYSHQQAPDLGTPAMHAQYQQSQPHQQVYPPQQQPTVYPPQQQPSVYPPQSYNNSYQQYPR